MLSGCVIALKKGLKRHYKLAGEERTLCGLDAGKAFKTLNFFEHETVNCGSCRKFLKEASLRVDNTVCQIKKELGDLL